MKIFSMIVLALMLSSCYHIYVPFHRHHHHRHEQITDDNTANRLNIEIGGQLYVDDIIR
jgi:hypothetical protein